MFNLDGLPDSVLVEILGHLSYEFVVQCMCVSKRWYSLVFNPYFLSRFSARSLILTNPKTPNDFFSMSSEQQPPALIKLRNFSLSFLPCFQGPPAVRPSSPDVDMDGPGPPTVVASYNDLVLCCATTFSQREYYICNPYTKQWDALPPPPQCHVIVIVGLICSPCDGGVLNNEYSYRVVRLIFTLPYGNRSKQFKVEIFASETRTWTETVVSSPREFSVISLLPMDAAVGYDGMLYFWGSDGLIGLDPYPSNINTAGGINCRFIELPEGETDGVDLHLPEDVRLCTAFVYLGAINARTGRGSCMRMCESLGHSGDGRAYLDGLAVWEYFEDDQIQVDNAGKRWCLVDVVRLNWIRQQCPFITDCSCTYKIHVNNFTTVLGFDPNNEDILYLEFCQHIVMYNVGAKSVTAAWKTELSHGRPRRGVFPFMLPWWATPVLGHKQREGSSSNHVAEKVSVSAAARATNNAISNPSVSTRSRSSSSSTRTGLEENVANKKGSTKEHMSACRRPKAYSKACKKRKANEAAEDMDGTQSAAKDLKRNKCNGHADKSLTLLRKTASQQAEIQPQNCTSYKLINLKA